MEFFAKVRALLTPARVEVLKTDLLALAAFIAAVVGTLPAGWQNGALAAAALATKVAGTLSFLKGNRAWETSPAGQATTLAAVDSVTSADGLPADDVEFDVPPPDVEPTEPAVVQPSQRAGGEPGRVEDGGEFPPLSS